jgi:hypothetical protein
MRILRGVLIALSILFLLATMGLPFGVRFAFRGWYVDGGAAKIESAQKEADQKLAELKQQVGGNLPAYMQKEIDEATKKQNEMLSVAKSMANWELALMLCALVVTITLFLSKRVIPLSAAGLLILLALAAIVLIPDIKLGIGETSGFEIKAIGMCAIIAAVLGILASLIGMKKVPAPA